MAHRRFLEKFSTFDDHQDDQHHLDYLSCDLHTLPHANICMYMYVKIFVYIHIYICIYFSHVDMYYIYASVNMYIQL